MSIDRRTLMLFAANATFGSAAQALALAQSLQNDLLQAISKNQPLIVMVGFASCPYCKLVRQNYMPAVQNEHKLKVVEIDMYTDTSVRNFLGTQTTHRKIAKDWNVKTSPTVLFFGKEGHEVAKRLVGGSIDFYNAYLEERITEAVASFKK